MISLLISILISAACVYAALTYQLATTWVVLSGIGGYIASSLLVGLVVRRKLGKVQGELQDMMTQAQGRINRSIQEAQIKPGANPALLKKQVEIKQTELLKKALDHTTRLEPYQKWAPTLGRQIATMRLQFYYQLKQFDEVDAIFATKGLLKKPMLMEPTVVAMKMARAYKTGELEDVEKLFKKHIRWMKGDRGTLLYGLMSWVWVKKGKADEALNLLAKAKDSTGDDTLTLNWERLANDKVKKFSNAGLGEEWYALHLEAQPTPKAQRMRGQRGKARF